MILWTNLPLITPFFSPPSVILNQQITIFLYFVVFLSISRNLGGKKGSEFLEWWQRQDMHGDVFPGALSGAADFCFFSLAPSLVLVRFGSERSWKHRFLTQRDHNFTGWWIWGSSSFAKMCLKSIKTQQFFYQYLFLFIQR